MIKKLEGSALLIIIGEVLSWVLPYFSNNDNTDFSQFTSGVLLGLSVGMKLIGILLLFLSIVEYKKTEATKEDEKTTPKESM